MPDFLTVKRYFDGALGQPGASRMAWLEAQCGNDRGLFDEVLSLLEADAQASMAPAPPQRTGPAIPPDAFGPYRAKEFLGRGGSSTVYLGERVDGRFHQTVALKVMTPFLDAPEFLRRFCTEREVLASLNHSNIAHLLDGGDSSAGQPFLAMEYVGGARLDAYCDCHRLPLRARLELLLQVCDAVDYAHGKLIVHRDLKPNNILVTPAGVVKLLDFGTAGLLAVERDATVARSRMVTPRYSAPERLRGEPANIANDVFSLGVVLYELMTGVSPFGDADSYFGELRRTLEETVPPRPESVITAAAAQARSTQPEALRKRVAGDLAAIASKALEHDPDRRYSSVRDLASDLRNYLAARPVNARKPTAAYKTRRFLRRNWPAVTAATLTLAGLAAAAGVAFTQAHTARVEALKTEAVNGFLTSMLGAFGGYRFDGEKYTVAEMLDAAERTLDANKSQDPLLKATLRLSLAKSYLALGRLNDSSRQVEQAAAGFAAVGALPEQAQAAILRGRINSFQGRSEEAVRSFEQSLTILQRLGEPPATSVAARVEFANALNVGNTPARDKPRVEHLLREAVHAAERYPAVPRVDAALAMAGLGELLALDKGRTREGEALLERALETGRTEDPGGPWETGPLTALASIYEGKGDLVKAREFARRKADILTRILGPNQPDSAIATIAWARLAARSGQTVDAAEAVDRVVPALANLPLQSPSLWVATRDAAAVMWRAGRLADAERFARQSMAVAQAENLAENDPRMGNAFEVIGNVLKSERKNGEALSALEKARAIYASQGAGFAGSEERMRRAIDEIRGQAAASR